MNANPRRIGKYELQELLGQGSMTEVWKAVDTQQNRYVAIKLFHPQLQAVERRATARFQKGDVVEPRVRPQIRDLYAGTRLIDVPS